MLQRLFSNASANVAAGVSTMILQMGLTGIASRIFTGVAFSIWSLALSLAALTPLFAANLSTIVTRQLVRIEPDPAGRSRQVIMAVAGQLAMRLSAAALVFTLVASLLLHRYSLLLAGVSNSYFAFIVCLLTVGQLWQIMLQPLIGWHYSREQNWTAAAGVFAARAAALLSMWLVFRLVAGVDHLVAAACLAIGTWAGIGIAHRLFLAPRLPRVGGPEPEMTARRAETMSLLKGFAIWSLGSAAIQYSLPAGISVIAPARYNAFYLAYSLNLIVVGVVGAAGSALMAPITRLQTTGNRQRLVLCMKYLPVASGTALLLSLAVLSIGMPRILSVWSPNVASPQQVRSFLHLLGFQTIARSMAVVFAIVLSAAGGFRQLIGPTLLEAGLSLIIVAPLSLYFGANFMLLGLVATGEIAAIATAVVTISISNLGRLDRRAILVRFLLSQACILGTWAMVT